MQDYNQHGMQIKLADEGIHFNFSFAMRLHISFQYQSFLPILNNNIVKCKKKTSEETELWDLLTCSHAEFSLQEQN